MSLFRLFLVLMLIALCILDLIFLTMAIFLDARNGLLGLALDSAAIFFLSGAMLRMDKK